MWVATERSYRLTQTPFKSAKNCPKLSLIVQYQLELHNQSYSETHKDSCHLLPPSRMCIISTIECIPSFYGSTVPKGMFYESYCHFNEFSLKVITLFLLLSKTSWFVKFLLSFLLIWKETFMSSYFTKVFILVQCSNKYVIFKNTFIFQTLK